VRIRWQINIICFANYILRSYYLMEQIERTLNPYTTVVCGMNCIMYLYILYIIHKLIQQNESLEIH
jgi:hypothetical protein